MNDHDVFLVDARQAQRQSERDEIKFPWQRHVRRATDAGEIISRYENYPIFDDCVSSHFVLSYYRKRFMVSISKEKKYVT